MDKTYIISWKARDNGRAGQGKKLMDRQEAEQLAHALNEEYPEFEHFALNINPAAQDSQTANVAENATNSPESSQTAQPTPELVTVGKNSVSASESEVTAYDNHEVPAPEFPEKTAA